jgi:hypothetical protein
METRNSTQHMSIYRDISTNLDLCSICISHAVFGFIDIGEMQLYFHQTKSLGAAGSRGP